ncbi:MAG: ADP-ribosylglycohydrolase family protein [Armatimonadetes bacterium]|nr:ADP-ribosylglycohydrolase family protein [Armatimonadota bacterium]
MNVHELEALMPGELAQRREEGCDIGGFEAAYKAAKEKTGQEKYDALSSLYDALDALAVSPDFPYREPSDLEEIRAVRPDGPRKIAVSLPEEALYDKIYGAWLGRAGGCLLGKPVEGWHKSRIASLLKAIGEYPMEDYLPRRSDIPEDLRFGDWMEGWLRGGIQCMVRDDDMDYPIIGLHTLEEHGPDFKPAHVAGVWLNRVPFNMVYTAERVAYRNLVDGYPPPESATVRNPYREWIGAQIRADIWGYVHPARPERAAEFAWRDASISHTKNGIYGEMWVAAMLAAAFTTDDIEEIVSIGLSEIPEKCRLAEAVKDTLAWSKSEPTWEAAWEKMNAKYGHYHGVHTINNAACVLLGLLYSGGDYEKAITISVMAGWDTDCNGATAGSILGAILGASRLPGKWINPLNDRLLSIVIGFTDSRISDLAKRTMKFAQKG